LTPQEVVYLALGLLARVAVPFLHPADQFVSVTFDAVKVIVG
jgi:hypothetical protein